MPPAEPNSGVRTMAATKVPFVARSRVLSLVSARFSDQTGGAKTAPNQAARSGSFGIIRLLSTAPNSDPLNGFCNTGTVS